MFFKKFNFKKECIHCIPEDESLIGKRVLFGDTWTDIKGQVERNNWTSCRRTLKLIDHESCCPFIIDNDFKTGQYKFVYYDPEWNELDCVKCKDLKIGDIISNGEIDYMVLGLNHSGGIVSDVFLPCIGWRDVANLKDFYKKE